MADEKISLNSKYEEILNKAALKKNALPTISVGKVNSLVPDTSLLSPKSPLLTNSLSDDDIYTAYKNNQITAKDIAQVKGTDYLSGLNNRIGNEIVENFSSNNISALSEYGKERKGIITATKDLGAKAISGTLSTVGGLAALVEGVERSKLSKISELVDKNNANPDNNQIDPKTATTNLSVPILGAINRGLTEASQYVEQNWVSGKSQANTLNEQNNINKETAQNEKEYQEAIAKGDNASLANAKLVSKDIWATIKNKSVNSIAESVVSSAPSIVASAAAGAVGGLPAAYGMNVALNASEAVQETLKKVDDTPDAELLKTSSKYIKYRNAGLPEEEAKERLKNDISAVAVNPALATSLFTSAIDLPFITKLFPKAGKSVLTHLPEAAKTAPSNIFANAAQEGANKFVENYATREVIDPETTLTDNLGQAIGEGAVTGAGMSATALGVSVTPTIARKIKEKSLKGVDVVKNKRAESKFAKTMDEAVKDETTAEVFTNDIDLSTAEVSPETKEKLKSLGEESLGNALVRINKVLRNKDIPEEDKQSLRILADSKLVEINEYANDIHAKTKNMSQEEIKNNPDLAKKSVEIAAIIQSPIYNDLLNEVSKFSFTDEEYDRVDALPEDFKPEDLTPEVKENLNKVFQQIDLNNGHKFSPEVIKSIIKNASTLGLSEGRVAQLKAVSFSSEKAEGVTKDITVGNAETGLSMMSLQGYQNLIGKALKDGNQNKLNSLFTKLEKFSNYFERKSTAYSDALKQAQEEGKTVTPLKGDGTPYLQKDNKSAIAIHPKSGKLVNDVINDANHIKQTYNYLSGLRDSVLNKTSPTPSEAPKDGQVPQTEEATSNIDDYQEYQNMGSPEQTSQETLNKGEPTTPEDVIGTDNPEDYTNMETSYGVHDSVPNEILNNSINDGSEATNEDTTEKTQDVEKETKATPSDLSDDSTKELAKPKVNKVSQALNSLVRNIKLDPSTKAAKETNPHEKALYTDNLLTKYGEFKTLETPFATENLREDLTAAGRSGTKIKNVLKNAYAEHNIETPVNNTDAVVAATWNNIATHMIETLKADINIPATERLYFRSNTSAYFLQESDGRYEFPDTVVEAMAAGVLGYFESPSALNMESMLALDSLENGAEDASMYKLGVNRNDAISSLSKLINSVLGLKLNDNVPAMTGDNIEKALAVEAYQYMVNQGLLTETPIYTVLGIPYTESAFNAFKEAFYKNPDNKNKQIKAEKFIYTRPNDEDVIIKGVKIKPNEVSSDLKQTDVLDNLFFPEKNITKVSTVPFEKVDTMIKQGVNQKVSNLAAKQLLDYSNRPMKINTELHNFLFNELGEDTVKDILDYVHYDQENTNVKYNEVLEGKNTTINTQITNWNLAYKRLENSNFDFEKDSIYIPYKQASVARFIAQSKDMNYQLYKLHRELLNHEHEDLDLTDNAQRYGLELAIAQGLGIKVDKLSNTTSLEQYNDIIETPDFRKVIDNIKDHLINSESIDKQSFVNLVKNIGEQTKTANALFTQAQYEVAKERGKSYLKTGITLEIDGVTKGVSDFLMQIGLLGDDPAETLNILNRVGIFYNSDNQSYNNFIEETPEFNDTYTQASKTLQKMLENELGSLPDETRQVVNDFFGLIGDIRINEDGTVTVTRKDTKNPVTVFQYGGSIKSLTEKLIQTATTEMYRRINETISNPDLLDDTNYYLNTMFGQPPLKMSELKDFRLDFNHLDTLNSLYVNRYVTLLNDAVEATIPALRPIGNKLTALSSIFGFFQQKQYENEIKRLTTEHIKAGDRPRTDTLTRKDMKQVIRNIDKVALAFPSPYNNEKSSIQQMTWLTDLQYSSKQVEGAAKISPLAKNTSNNVKKLTFSNYTKEFETASVRILPYMVISQEAKMMSDTITHFKDKTLKNVFDGAETHPADVYAFHEVLNNKVNNVWTDYQMLSGIVGRFRDMLSNNKALLDTLTEEEIPSEIVNTLYKLTHNGKAPSKLSPAFSGLVGKTGYENLTKILDNLEEYANAHNTLKENLLSKSVYVVDQMAGISDPVVINSHKALVNDNSLNSIKNVIEKTKQDLKVESLENIDNPNINLNFGKPKFSKFTGETPVTLDKDGILRYYQGIKKTAFQEVKNIPDILIKNIMQALPADTTVTLGSEEAINKLLATKYRETSITGSRGLAINNEIYITSTTGETLVHELVHATIEQTLASYYRNEGIQLNKKTKTNIKQLENLMHDYVSQFSDRPENELDAMSKKLLGIITPFIEVGDTESALHEFMAWGLTNQELQNSLSTPTTSRIKRIKNAIVQFIKDLLNLPVDSNTYLEHLMNRSITLLKHVNTYNTKAEKVIIRNGKTFAQIDLTDITSRNVEDIYNQIEQDNNPELNKVFNSLNENITKLFKTTNHIDGFYRKNNSILFNENSSNIKTTADEFIAQGFKLTEQQELVFRLNQAVLSTGLENNSQSVKRAIKYYDIASKELTYKDLMVDPNDTSPYEIMLARRRYAAIFEGRGIKGNTELSNFLSLSQVYPPLKKALKRVKHNLNEKPETMSKALSQYISSMVNWLGRVNTKDTKAKNLNDSLNILNENISFIRDAKNISALDKVLAKTDEYETITNDFATGKLSKIGEKIFTGSTYLKKLPIKNKYGKLLVNSIDLSLKAATSLMNEDVAIAAKKAAEEINNTTSSGQTLSDLGHVANEVIGGQDEGKMWRKLLTIIKYFKDTKVQKLRENTAENIRAQFKKMDKKLSHSITKVLFMTDANSLLKQGMSLSQLADIIDSDTKISQELSKNVKEIQKVISHLTASEHQNVLNYYKNQSVNLAHNLVHGKGVFSNLQDNAYRIATFANTDTLYSNVTSLSHDDLVTLSSLIDKHVSLEALKLTKKSDRVRVKKSIEFESTQKNNAYTTTFSLLNKIQEEEKLNNPNLLGFGVKGYVPIRTNSHKDMITVNSASKVKELEAQGYVKTNSYVHPLTKELITTMISSEKTQTSYLSGVYNSISPMISGMNLETNNPQNSKATYKVFGKKAYDHSNNIVEQQQLRSLITENPIKVDSNTLQPILNADMTLKGYYVPHDHASTETYLEPDYDFANILGNYQARTYQTIIADTTNNALFDQIKSAYEKDKKLGKDRFYTFINLNNALANNIHVNQVINTFSNKTKESLLERFPDGRVPILKSEMNNIFGFKKASVTDIFNGTSRLPEPIQNSMKVIFTGLFGSKAPLYLGRSERALKELVSIAKGTIVVKSFTVARDNFLGNMMYLMVQGINPVKIARWTTEAYLNVEHYNKSMREIDELEFFIAHNVNKENKAKYQTKVNILKEAIRTNPVSTLIEAGLLPSITDDINTFKDYTYFGKIKSAITPYTDKLPQSVQKLGKEVLVMEGSKVHASLEKAVQYGDFVAKYALYKHLTTKTKPMSHDEALERASIEFVNYNLLSSRTRDYLDSVGITWFLNYKLRMQRIIARAIREHPIRALISIGMSNQLPFGRANVLYSNVITGNLSYAFGGVTNIPSALAAHPLFSIF